MKIFKSINRRGQQIYLSTADFQVDPSERKKKLGTESCLWNPDLEKNFLNQGEWLETGKGYVRAGVSTAVFDKNRDFVILNRFDQGHPTAAGKYTPPAGLWDSEDDLKTAALKELGQEVILISEDGCDLWLYEGIENLVLEGDWVSKYVIDHDLRVSFNLISIKDLFLQRDDIFDIILDGESQGKALLAMEPETGSVEFIFLFQLVKETFYPQLKDGEFFKEWLDRKVEWFSKDDLNNHFLNLTSKAKKILSIMV